MLLMFLPTTDIKAIGFRNKTYNDVLIHLMYFMIKVFFSLA